MVFPAGKKIRFVANDKNRQNIFVSVDGNDPLPLTEGDVVEIRRSVDKIRLVSMNDNSFYNSLNRKLMHPIK